MQILSVLPTSMPRTPGPLAKQDEKVPLLSAAQPRKDRYLGVAAGVAGGAALAMQGLKRALMAAKPFPNPTPNDHVTQVCHVETDRMVPQAVYELLGCPTNASACNDVLLDERRCQQPDCVGTPSNSNPGCWFQPAIARQGEALTAACLQHQLSCLGTNLELTRGANDQLRARLDGEALSANVTSAALGALAGALLLRAYCAKTRG